MKTKYFLILLFGLIAISSCSFHQSKEFKGLLRSTEKVLASLDTNNLPKAALNYVVSGSKLQQEHKYAEAAIEFQQALRCDSSASIYFALGNAYMQMGKLELAVEAVIKAIKKDNKFSEAYKLLADCYVMSYDLDAAIETYEELIRFYPGFDAKFSLARLYDLAGQTPKAMAIYDELYKNNNDYNSLVRIAELSYLKGDSAKYIETLQMAHKANPEDEETAVLICEFFTSKRDYSKAINLINEVEPTLSSVNLIKCFNGLINKLWNDSLSVAKLYAPQVLSKIDNRFYFDSQTMVRSGFLAQRIGDTAKAENYLKIAVNITDSIPELPLQLALFYRNTNRAEKALSILNQYEQKFPNFWAYPFYKSIIFVEKNDVAEAFSSIRKADSLEPNNEEIQGQLAYVYQIKKDYVHSDSLFNILLTKSPDNALLNNNYAYSLAERGENLTLAHKLIQIAIKYEPNNSSFLDTYSWIKYKMGDYEIALNYALDALKYTVEPNPEIYEHLGEIYFKKGDIENAITNWQEAVKLNSPNAKEIIKKILQYKKK